MAKDVFISYAAEDQGFADIVCAAFERQGLICWIAPRDVAPGMVFDEAIIDAIEACQVLVLVLSKSANLSPFVHTEVNRAFSKGRPIVTFRAENVLPAKSLELYLARHHWVDGFPPPLDEKANRLGAAVLALVRRTPGPSIIAEPSKPAAPKTLSAHEYWTGMVEESDRRGFFVGSAVFRLMRWISKDKSLS
jgi:hypothetical protein